MDLTVGELYSKQIFIWACGNIFQYFLFFYMLSFGFGCVFFSHNFYSICFWLLCHRRLSGLLWSFLMVCLGLCANFKNNIHLGLGVLLTGLFSLAFFLSHNYLGLCVIFHGLYVVVICAS